MQHTEPASRRDMGCVIGGIISGATQDRQRLGRRLTQRAILARARDPLREPHRGTVVGRVRRPKAVEFELPFREMAIHGEYQITEP